MVHAIRFHQPGGPEVLKWEEIEVGDPGPGQVRLKHTAVGSQLHRHLSQERPVPGSGPPCIPGMEGAGVIEAVGEGVTSFQPGDRVAYASAPIGAYAESA